MKTDRPFKILLSAITLLLSANLLVSLRDKPVQAQQSSAHTPRYRLITGDYPWDSVAPSMNKDATEGYRFKGIAGDHSEIFIVMEK